MFISTICEKIVFWLILCLFLRFEKLLTNDFFWSYYIETNVQSLYLKFSVWLINWSLIGCKMWGNRGLPRLLAVWQFLDLKEIHLKMSFSIIFSQNHHIFFILAVVFEVAESCVIHQKRHLYPQIELQTQSFRFKAFRRFYDVYWVNYRKNLFIGHNNQFLSKCTDKSVNHFNVLTQSWGFY